MAIVTFFFLFFINLIEYFYSVNLTVCEDVVFIDDIIDIKLSLRISPVANVIVILEYDRLFNEWL